jgi:hypothetical protein
VGTIDIDIFLGASAYHAYNSINIVAPTSAIEELGSIFVLALSLSYQPPPESHQVPLLSSMRSPE